MLEISRTMWALNSLKDVRYHVIIDVTCSRSIFDVPKSMDAERAVPFAVEYGAGYVECEFTDLCCEEIAALFWTEI